MSTKEKYCRKARKFYDDKNFEEAVYWYSRCISVDDQDAEIYEHRGVAYFHLGDMKSSLADMNRALELEPDRSYRHSSRAYIRDAMGDTEGAVEDYRTAVNLDPEDAIAFNNLGLLEEKLGRHRQAKTFFEFADAIAKEQSGDRSKPEEYPSNIQSEINRERKEGSVISEMSNVFKSKKNFQEFLTFIRNGFK